MFRIKKARASRDCKLMRLCVCNSLAVVAQLGSLSEFMLGPKQLALRAIVFDEVVCL